MSPTLVVASFHAAIGAFDLTTLALLRRRPSLATVAAAALVHGGLSTVVAATLALSTELRAMGFLSLVCGLLFVHLPIMLAAAALLLRRDAPRAAAVAGLLAATLPVVGGYAFFVEPRMLETNVHTVPAPGLTEPLRIAVLADLQTDRIGDHERRAIAIVAAAEPDLVLLPGDYVQVLDHPAFVAGRDALRAALNESRLAPRWGAFAVQGDVDGIDWPTLFEGTVVTPLLRSTTLDVGPITLTGLGIRDGRAPDPPIPASDRYHVVFSHDPRFVLASKEPDLALAGHTHGGQVAFPWIGPPITLSTVPRAWGAGGLVALPWGGHLIVSRGVGMERIHAPRLRFGARPEVVIVDLLPAPEGT